MELVYLWLEKYECFRDTGFNLSNIFRFKYNKEDNRLTISDLPMKNVNQFLYKKNSNITNVSVVVGDNGAGKTSLLKGIIDFLAIYENYSQPERFIGIFYNRYKSELKIFSINTPELKINSEECKNVSVNTIDKNSFQEMVEQTKLIYMNNVLDFNDYTYAKNGHVVDLSIGGLLKNNFSPNIQYELDMPEDPLLQYFNNEVYRQLNFLYEYKPKDLDTILPFKLPSTLKVKVLRSSQRYSDVIGDLMWHNPEIRASENLTPERQEIDNQITTLVNMLHQKKKKTKTRKWIINLVENLFLNALLEAMRVSKSPNADEKKFNCLLNAYQPAKEDETIILYVINYLDRVKEELNNLSIYSDMLNPFQDFLKWLEGNNLFDFESTFIESGSFYIESEFIYIEFDKSKKKSFQEFFILYNKTCQPYYYLNFSWGLSTGENNLLNLYARLFFVLEVYDSQPEERRVINYLKNEVECTNVLLLIDEADLSFHPKWQIQYVDVLLKIIADLFRDCQVQVILTTHSPILLSDFPKNNVIYLKQGVNDSDSTHKETFGQNIHTLFTDAFFLEKDKAMGQFSDQIIKEVGEDLDEIVKGGQAKNYKGNRENQLEYYKTIISIIGEPIIRRAFEFKLKEVEATYQTEKLKKAINIYNDLSSEDRDLLIQHIINEIERDTNHEEN